jgi:hypothetical protein
MCTCDVAASKVRSSRNFGGASLPGSVQPRKTADGRPASTIKETLRSLMRILTHLLQAFDSDIPYCRLDACSKNISSFSPSLFVTWTPRQTRLHVGSEAAASLVKVRPHILQQQGPRVSNIGRADVPCSLFTIRASCILLSYVIESSIFWMAFWTAMCFSLHSVPPLRDVRMEWLRPITKEEEQVNPYQSTLLSTRR